MGTGAGRSLFQTKRCRALPTVHAMVHTPLYARRRTLSRESTSLLRSSDKFLILLSLASICARACMPGCAFARACVPCGGMCMHARDCARMHGEIARARASSRSRARGMRTRHVCQLLAVHAPPACATGPSPQRSPWPHLRAAHSAMPLSVRARGIVGAKRPRRGPRRA